MTQAADDPAALSLSLHNAGTMPIQIALQPAAYAQAQPREQLQLAGGQTWQRSWKAAASGGWYDLWIDTTAQANAWPAASKPVQTASAIRP